MTATVTSPLVSDCIRALDVVVIGSPSGERVERFQGALARLGAPPARIVSYLDLLDGGPPPGLLRPGTLLRLESPDRDLELLRAFLALGVDLEDEEGEYARMTRKELEEAPLDPHRILCPRQWFLGYREALRRISRSFGEQARWMIPPGAVLEMSDKPLCHGLLRRYGIPVPRGLGVVRSYEELRERMRQTDTPRVFVKLAHGSSASGVVAYQTNGRSHRAVTTTEVARTPLGVSLYNTKRLRACREEREIATLIDELCRHRAHVEAWYPKAGFRCRTFDLRVLVIAGEARHVVVRTSRSPITNLHLADDRTVGRATLEELLPSWGQAAWEAARAGCERAMAVWPDALYAGFDLMVSSDRKGHALAEVNAFGDLLYGALHRGQDPYEAEVRAAVEREAAV